MRRMFSLNQLKEISKEVIESGAVSNAKPIYCHPIEIYKSNVCNITCLIFNNTNDKINTYDKLKQAIHNFGGTVYNRLHASGGFYTGEKTLIVSELVEFITQDNKFKLVGLYTDGDVEDSGLDITSETFNIVDDVNKIN